MVSEAPPEWADKILYGRITVGDTDVIGSDALPQGYLQPQGFSVLLNMDDPIAAERVFYGLAENGTVQAPIQKTFWAARFGMVVDQFGIPWEINCDEAE